jgi:ribosomal protein uL13
MMVIDCKNQIFGRVSTKVAKSALMGEEVHLINVEDMVICGNPVSIVDRFRVRRSLKNKATPENSPHWPRVPHFLVKRMVRGMLPKKCKRGKEALGRIIAYSGNPKNLDSNTKVEGSEYDGIKKHIKIMELCRRLGYSG